MKALSRPARQLLKSPASMKSSIHMTNLQLVSLIAQHAALLDDDSLSDLPAMGVVLFDPDHIGALSVCFDSLAVKILGRNDLEIRQIISGSLRCLTPGLFEGLTEWALISSHHQNRPATAWDELSRYDRIACVSSMLTGLGPLEMIINRIYESVPSH